MEVEQKLTATPYLRASPCNVSVLSKTCFKYVSLVYTALVVVPYFVLDLALLPMRHLSLSPPSAILVYVVRKFYANYTVQFPENTSSVLNFPILKKLNYWKMSIHMQLQELTKEAKVLQKLHTKLSNQLTRLKVSLLWLILQMMSDNELC